MYKKTQNSSNFEKQIDNNDENRFIVIESSKNVDYFDFLYVDFNDSTNTTFIVNVDRHVFYRDVYVFINRLKNFVNKFIDE